MTPGVYNDKNTSITQALVFANAAYETAEIAAKNGNLTLQHFNKIKGQLAPIMKLTTDLVTGIDWSAPDLLAADLLSHRTQIMELLAKVSKLIKDPDFGNATAGAATTIGQVSSAGKYAKEGIDAFTRSNVIRLIGSAVPGVMSLPQLLKGVFDVIEAGACSTLTDTVHENCEFETSLQALAPSLKQTVISVSQLEPKTLQIVLASAFPDYEYSVVPFVLEHLHRAFAGGVVINNQAVDAEKVYNLLGGYNFMLWTASIILSKSQQLPNNQNVSGIPKSTNVYIPRCVPHRVTTIRQGETDIYTPVRDPTLYASAEQQCPNYMRTPKLDIQLTAEFASPAEKALEILNQVFNSIQRIDGSTRVQENTKGYVKANGNIQRSAGATDASWSSIGGPQFAGEFAQKLFGTTFSPYRVLTPYYTYENPKFGYEPQFRYNEQSTYPEQVIEDMAFKGFAQFRLWKVESKDDNAVLPGQQTVRAGYAIRCEFLQHLDHKEGVRKLGGDAYFSWDSAKKKGSLTHIVYLGKKYQKGNPGWEVAMMMFRGSLNMVVTAGDHLYYLHLTVSNGLSIANAEGLPHDHWLRRLNTKFTFRTIEINRLAASMLIPTGGMVHRAGPLTEKGMKELWSKVTQIYPIRFTIKEHVKKMGIPPEMQQDLPHYRDGLRYFDIVRNYVKNHFEAAGLVESSEECAAPSVISIGEYNKRRQDTVGTDKDTLVSSEQDILLNFYDHWNVATPNFNLPTGASCTNMIDALAATYWEVSGLHNVVGTLESENADPCLAPWTVNKDELCGAPQESLTQMLTFMLTSLYEPQISEDYTHLFEGITGNAGKHQQAERDFVKEIKRFSDSLPDCEDIPDGKCEEYLTFKPIQNKTYRYPYTKDIQNYGRHFGMETCIQI